LFPSAELLNVDAVFCRRLRHHFRRSAMTSSARYACFQRSNMKIASLHGTCYHHSHPPRHAISVRHTLNG